MSQFQLTCHTFTLIQQQSAQLSASVWECSELGLTVGILPEIILLTNTKMYLLKNYLPTILILIYYDSLKPTEASFKFSVDRWSPFLCVCMCSVPHKDAYSIITLWWCVTAAVLIKCIDHCLSAEHSWSRLTHYESKKWHIVGYIRLDPWHGALDLKSIHKFPRFPCLQQLLGRWRRFTDPLTPSVSTAALRLPSLSAWTTGSARGSRPLLWCCLHAMQMIGKQTAPHRATRSPRPSLQPMQISAHRALGSHEAGN